MTQHWLTGIFLTLAIALPQLASGQDSTVDRLLASQCAQCHGTNGYAVGEFEELAGEEAKDLYEDLTDMKGEDTPENIMDHQALGYSNDQIRRIARYYATLPEEQGKSEGESAAGSPGQSPTQATEEDQKYDKEDEEH